MMDMWTYAFLFLLLVLGSAIREVMAVMGRTNEEPPSFKRYWKNSRNRWNVWLNVLCNVALLLVHQELIDLGSFPYPNILALTTGFLGASLFRALTNMVGQRFGVPPQE